MNQPLLKGIALWCCDLQLEHIPKQVKDVATTAITDYLAVTIAGSQAPVAQNIQQFAASRAQNGSCQILGTDQTSSMAYASYANGVASHALDFDDVSWATIGHPTVTVAPAAFAAAEQQQLSGKDILLAYIAGVEAQHQIARWVMPALSEQGWHTTPAIGVFGATVAAGKLLGLNPEELTNALAIAASSASGVRGNFGSQSKPLHAGLAAFNGINAVELAQLGVTGKADVIESADGYAQCFTSLDLSNAKITLGKEWDLMSPGLVFKQYPCCSGSHPAVDCLSSLLEEHRFTAADIETINVGVSLLGPRELVCNMPQNSVEAKFSMQYALTARLLYGQVSLDQFTDQSVQNPEAQHLMSLISMEIDPELAKLGFIGTAPAKLSIQLKNGQEIKGSNDLAKGNPEKPLSHAEIEAKFRSCVEPVCGKQKTSDWLELLEFFEQAQRSQIIHLLKK